MRIIHCILGKANPERMNGVNRVVFELATQQARAGLTVEVWGITKDISHNYPAREFTTRLYREYAGGLLIPPSMKKDIRHLNKETVFHLHGGFVPVYPSVVSVLRTAEIPYVITPHGAYNKIARKKNQMIKNIYFTLFERRILSGTQYVHCLGNSELQEVSLFLDPGKVKLIPYGVEIHENNINLQKNTSRELSFGFCGRIDIHTKGLDLLLNGFALFCRSSSSPSVLHIIGGGEELNNLRHMADASGISENIIFHGPKYGQEKTDLLLQCDVFCHPSRNEGLPASVLEACMLGIPCMISEETNLADYIRRSGCGYVLKENTAHEICKVMIRCREEKRHHELTAKKEKSREMIAAEFSWKRIIPQFNTLYAGI